MAETPLWAAYVELVHGAGDGRSRHQYIMFPPVSEQFRTGGAGPIEHPSYFHRKQDRMDHRAVWRIQHLTTQALLEQFVDRFNDLESRGWIASPVITCQVHPLEFEEIVLSGWRTPYRIISRMQRVARIKHNFTI